MDRNAMVVTLGECMASFVARDGDPLGEATEFRRTIAGTEANVAVGLARLGIPVAFIGRVGADGLGAAVMRRLRGEGVDVSHLRRDERAATGIMVRDLRRLAPAEVVYWRRGSAGSRLSREDVVAGAAMFESAAWLHITGVTPAISTEAAEAVAEAVQLAQAAGMHISLDVNVRLRLWTDDDARAALAPLAARCDTVLGSVDELALLGGLAVTLDEGALSDAEAAADAVLALGPTAVVAKLGAGGSLVRRWEAGVATTIGARALAVGAVVDPVGAGDAFTAGYIASILDGHSVHQALRAANACGAAVVSAVGDMPALLTRAELDRLLAGVGRDVDR